MEISFIFSNNFLQLCGFLFFLLSAPSTALGQKFTHVWRCCILLSQKIPLANPTRLDRLHEQAIYNPLFYDELVQLHHVFAQ